MLGIIGAMKVEVEALKQLMENVEVITISGIEFYRGILCGSEVVVAVSGVGKVNAAICAQTMIIVFKAKAIINIGVAGGLSDTLRVCDVAVADAVVQHDMDTSALGDPVGFISGLDVIYIKSDKAISDKLCEAAQKVGSMRVERGTIASGDCFVSGSGQKSFLKDSFGAIAAEMEGAAVGQTCAVNNVPFGVLRAISDGADDGAPTSFEEFTVKAVKNSIAIIIEFIKGWRDSV